MPSSNLAPTPPPTSFDIDTMAPPSLSLSLSSLSEETKNCLFYQEEGLGWSQIRRQKKAWYSPFVIAL
jgi:hypothetical protein